MRVLYSGVDFPHKNGEFSPRRAYEDYGVFHFSTPFVYEQDGVLRWGEAGDLLITKPGDMVWHGPCSNNESFTNDWMYITEDFGALLAQYPIPTGKTIPIGRQRRVADAIDAAEAEQLLKNSGYAQKVDCILTEMVIDLYRLHQKSEEQTPTLRVEQIRDTIMQMPQKQWTVEEMAAMSGYSVSRFCWLYKTRFRSSPKGDLLQKRLAMAKQQLKYSNLPVSVIGENCGFPSPYYFSKYFKKKTGLAPVEYRKQHL